MREQSKKDLQSRLKTRNLPISGKKEELVKRLQNDTKRRAMNKLKKTELVKSLEKKGLSKTGTKNILLNRLISSMRKVKLSENKPLKSEKRKRNVIRESTNYKSQRNFHLSLYFQKPESKMAQNWIRNTEISKNELEMFKAGISKKTRKK